MRTKENGNAMHTENPYTHNYSRNEVCQKKKFTHILIFRKIHSLYCLYVMSLFSDTTNKNRWIVMNLS